MSIKRTKEQKLNKELAVAYAIIALSACGRALNTSGWGPVLFLAITGFFAWCAFDHYRDSRKTADE